MARWAGLGAHVAAFAPGERGPAPPPPGPPSGSRAFGLFGHRAPLCPGFSAMGLPGLRAPPPGSGE